MMIKFSDAATLKIVYQALTGIVDCRLMFLGDHQRQLIRLFEEISYRFQRTRDSEKLYKSLTSSAGIQQFYHIEKSNGKVSITLRDEIFTQPGPLDEVQIEIHVSGNGRTIA